MDYAPPPALALDATRLRAALLAATEAHDPWLIHPALSVVTATPDMEAPTAARHLLLAVWVAAHSPIELGSVRLQQPCGLRTRSAPRAVPAGGYDLAALAAELAEGALPCVLALDPAGASLDLRHGEAWPLDEAAGSEIRVAAICEFFGTVALLEKHLPAIAAWMAAVTRVVIPFPFEQGKGFRSGSSSVVPGLVQMDIGRGVLSVVEGLAHETAHRYFYHAEAAGAFVAAEGQARRFASPLKREPRPLRGVMLAHHALVYILAVFAELADAGLVVDRERFEADRATLRDHADQAQATCLAARPFLTPLGQEFLDATVEIARHDLDRR